MAVTVARSPVGLAQRQGRVVRLPVGELDAVGVIGAAGGGRSAEKRVVRRFAGGAAECLEDRRRHGTSLATASAFAKSIACRRRPAGLLCVGNCQEERTIDVYRVTVGDGRSTEEL